MKKVFSLKYKFMGMFLYLILIPVLIISFFCIQQFSVFTDNILSEVNQSVEAISSENLTLSIDYNYEKINQLFNRMSYAARNVSESKNMSSFLKSETADYQAIQKISEKNLETILQACKFYQQNVRQLLSSKIEMAEYIFQTYGSPESKKNHWPITNQLTKKDLGIFIAAENPDSSKNPLMPTQINTSIYLEKDNVTGQWHACQYSPFRNTFNEIIGAIQVKTALDLDTFFNKNINVEPSENRYVFIMNGQGEICMHTKKYLIGKHVVDDLGIFEFEKMMADKTENTFRHISFTFENRHWDTYYAYFKEWDWYICLGLHLEESTGKRYLAALNTLKQNINECWKNTTVEIKNTRKHLFNEMLFIEDNGKEKISFQSGHFRQRDQNYTLTQWFKKIIALLNRNPKSHNSMKIGIGLSQDSGEIVFRIVVPVLMDKHLKGFLLFNMDWNIVWEILKENSYDNINETFIVDEKGRFLTHAKYTYNDHVNLTDKKFGELGAIASRKILKGESGFEKYILSGVDYIVNFRPIHIEEKTYSLITNTPVSKFAQIMRIIKQKTSDHYFDTIYLYVFIILFSVALAVLLFILFSQSVIKALTNIVKFTHKISEGDLSETLSIKRKDEIGEISDVLNSIAMKYRKLLRISNLRNLSTPIIEIDADYNLTFVNDAFCNGIGKTPDQCIGEKCYTLFQSALCQTENCGCFLAMNKKIPVRSQFRANWGEKQDIPVTTTCIPVEYNGNIEGSIIFIVEQLDLYNVIDEVRCITGDLKSSSEILSQLSENMAFKADKVVSLSEKSSANVEKISNAGDNISMIVENEAHSIKSMSNCLSQIAEKTQNAKDISQKARDRSKEVKIKMATMAKASEEIGDIIVVIDEIADRTDLLALNAAIEAEGAGSAGKGFAVVADEVQKLAKQSSDATNEITRQIENVRNNTSNTQQDIKEINNIIKTISSINEEIATAVEEQNYTALEILNTINNTTQQSRNVANDARDSFQMVNEISIVSKESAELAQQTNVAAIKLEEMATTLMEIVQKFDL